MGHDHGSHADPDHQLFQRIQAEFGASVSTSVHVGRTPMVNLVGGYCRLLRTGNK